MCILKLSYGLSDFGAAIFVLSPTLASAQEQEQACLSSPHAPTSALQLGDLVSLAGCLDMGNLVLTTGPQLAHQLHSVGQYGWKVHTWVPSQ